MLKERPENPLFQEIIETVAPLGVKPIDFGVHHHKGTVKAELIIYKKGGVSHENCREVSQILLPRLEILLDNQNINLEVSSPGISRKIKTFYELDTFVGEGVSLYLLSEADWISGILSKENGSYTLTNKEKIEIKPEEIQKAKLDDSVGIGR